MIFIKNIYYSLFPLRFLFKKILFLKEVVFHKGSKIMNSHFEGKNVIGSNCTLIDTSLGFGTYLANDTHLFKVSIGKFCSIGPNVKIGFGSHPVDFISTHPSFYSPLKQANFTFTESKSFFNEFKMLENNKLTRIGNNCWLGYDVAVLDGISIGDGAIVAAKSLVIHDVPPYTIVGGIPAKIIKLRFEENQVSRIIKMNKLWSFDIKWYNENYTLFHNIDNLDTLEKEYLKKLNNNNA